MIRYYKIGIVGRIIQDSMVIFLDEKDQNSTLILSHIHLLIGLSYPLWLSGLKGRFLLKIVISKVKQFIKINLLNRIQSSRTKWTNNSRRR